MFVSKVTDENENRAFHRDLDGDGQYHFNVANQFERSTAFGHNGDKAQFYDTFGDDVFVANGWNDAYLYADGRIVSYARGFGETTAYKERGGTDVAQFYDSWTPDEFIARKDSSTLRLAGSIYTHSQFGFDSVFAFGRFTNSVNDVLDNQVATDYIFIDGGGWESILR